MAAKWLSIVLTLVLGLGECAFADEVLLDYGPSSGTITATNYVDESNLYNHVQSGEFGNSVTITEFEEFGDPVFADATQFDLKLLADSGGVPGAPITSQTLALTSAEQISASLGEYDFTLSTPLTLQANTAYWIGLSGTNGAFTTGAVQIPGVPAMADFNGTTYTGMAPPDIGSEMMELIGYGNTQDASAAPLPSPQYAVVILLGALGLRTLARRRTEDNAAPQKTGGN